MNPFSPYYVDHVMYAIIYIYIYIYADGIRVEKFSGGGADNECYEEMARGCEKAEATKSAASTRVL